MGLFDFFFNKQNKERITAEEMSTVSKPATAASQINTNPLVAIGVDKALGGFNTTQQIFTKNTTTTAATDTKVHLKNKVHASKQRYISHGVHFNEAKHVITLKYRGLLAQNGAHNVHAVVGYGDNTKWEDIEHHPMHKIGPGHFVAHVPVARHGNINIAFSSGEHWDNNNKQNYTFMNPFYLTGDASSEAAATGESTENYTASQNSQNGEASSHSSQTASASNTELNTSDNTFYL